MTHPLYIKKIWASGMLLGIAFFATSCFWFTPKREGQALRAEVDQLKGQVKTLETELVKERESLTEMIARAREDVKTLEDTLGRATRLLARNSADFGADMEGMKAKMREVDGFMAEVRHEIEQTTAKSEETQKKVNEFGVAAGLDLPVDTSLIPANEKDHFQAIVSACTAGRYSDCRGFGDAFLKKYPKSDSADDVQLRMAQSHIAQKRWSKALGLLTQLKDTYTKSELMPETLYEMARCFYALGGCTDARIILDAVGAKYKTTPFAAKAKQLIEEISKNKAKCTS